MSWLGTSALMQFLAVFCSLPVGGLYEDALADMLPCLICFIAGHARKYVDEEEVYHGTWKERCTKLPETLILEAALEQQRQQKILHRHPRQN